LVGLYVVVVVAAAAAVEPVVVVVAAAAVVEPVVVGWARVMPPPLHHFRYCHYWQCCYSAACHSHHLQHSAVVAVQRPRTHREWSTENTSWRD